MFIFNNLLTEFVIQDIISANSARAAKPFFNILFDIKNITNVYIMSSSFSLTHYHSKECKNSGIKDNTNKLSDNLALKQKWEVIKHVRFKKLY